MTLALTRMVDFNMVDTLNFVCTLKVKPVRFGDGAIVKGLGDNLNLVPRLSAPATGRRDLLVSERVKTGRKPAPRLTG